MNLVCCNGIFLPENEKLFTAQNRSFRYGDGIFETIKIYKEKILFEDFHFERFFLSLKMLQIENSLTAQLLSSMIIELAQKNNCSKLGRVRLAAYRSADNNASYVIEATSLSGAVNGWNEKGMIIGIYPYARKNADAFSNLKTANFLPYVLGELYAKQNELDDAIVLNADNHIADTSKANIFLIKENEIHTPALHQGCINGVMRRYLIDELKKAGYRVRQKEISEYHLFEADEVFLTNSIFDIQWVKAYKDKKYSCMLTFSIYQKLVSPMYA